jgi:hypothetical protein
MKFSHEQAPFRFQTAKPFCIGVHGPPSTGFHESVTPIGDKPSSQPVEQLEQSELGPAGGMNHLGIWMT